MMKAKCRGSMPEVYRHVAARARCLTRSNTRPGWTARLLWLCAKIALRNLRIQALGAQAVGEAFARCNRLARFAPAAGLDVAPAGKRFAAIRAMLLALAGGLARVHGAEA